MAPTRRNDARVEPFLGITRDNDLGMSAVFLAGSRYVTGSQERASTGTYYAPANAATAQEIREVLEPLRGSGALIASHIRDETAGVIEAIDEALSIASALGVRQVISHHKVSGTPNFGRSRQTWRTS